MALSACTQGVNSNGSTSPEEGHAVILQNFLPRDTKSRHPSWVPLDCKQGRLTRPAVYRSLQMGKPGLECRVAAKGGCRGESAHARFAGALSKKVTARWTAGGLWRQAKRLQQHECQRQDLSDGKKDDNCIFSRGRDVGLVALLTGATCWPRNSDNWRQIPPDQINS